MYYYVLFYCIMLFVILLYDFLIVNFNTMLTLLQQLLQIVPLLLLSYHVLIYLYSGERIHNNRALSDKFLKMCMLSHVLIYLYQGVYSEEGIHNNRTLSDKFLKTCMLSVWENVFSKSIAN